MTDYAYDALNRLVSVSTHPDAQTNLTTSYTLDGNGQATSRTTADGVTVSYAYDALSRLTSVSATGLSITYAYDVLGRRTQMTDGTGTTTYAYDGIGRLTQVAAPSGTLTYAYDRDGALGYSATESVSYAYSPGGRMTTVTDWASRVSSYTYQASGLVSTVSYPNGMRASYSYDRAQRLTQIANAIGTRTITSHTYTLDVEGNRTALDEFVEGITVPPITWEPSVRVNDDTGTAAQDNPALALGVDGAGYLVWEDSRAGNSDIYFARRDPATGTWGANQKVNDDATTRGQRGPAMALDGSGNAYAVWEDDRNSGAQIDTDIYFAKRSATGAWSANVRVNDDTQGRPAQREPRIAVTSGGEATAVWLDPRGTGRQQNLYAATLLVGSSTWSVNQRVTDNTSSSKASPDVAVGPDGTAHAVWVDDRTGAGDVYYATRAPGSSVWSANVKVNDISGLPGISEVRIGVDETNNALVVWWRFNAGATLYSQRKSQGSSTWGPSRVVADRRANEFYGLTLAVASDGRAVTAWNDDSSGYFDVYGSEYDPNTQTWSASQRLSDDPGTAAQVNPSVALSASELGVAWRDDRSGNADIRARRRVTGPAIDHFTYAYDGHNRLLSVTGPVAETFTLDGATNLTSRTGPVATYTIDGANRVTSDGTRSFVWDAADRLVTRGADTFAYDALNRLTSSTVAAVTRTYAYDGDGLLRSRTEGAATTSFIYDPSLAPAPLLQVGTQRLVHGLGPLYLVHADGTFGALARDALGSVRAEVSGAGQLTNAYDYAAYGALRASLAGPPTVLGFAGELTDPSGLIYLRARWYDPVTGRFTVRDEFPGTTREPASLNGFGYAYGNPTLLTDPTGKCPPCLAVLAGIKLALFIADVVSTAETLTDPSISKGEKALVSGLFVAGILGSGGQATAGRLGIQAIRATGVAGKIRRLSPEAIDRVIDRDGVGVAPRAILDAVRSPVSVVTQANGRFRYVGREAEVVIDPHDGTLVTAWATSRSGWRLAPGE